MTSGKCENCKGPLLGARQKRFCSPGCACKFHHVLKCKARRDVVAPKAPRGARWIPLGGGGFALVDADRFEELNAEFWYKSKWGYVVRFDGQRVIWLHRVILGITEGDVDHINNDRADCRRANLRPATRSQNLMNKRKEAGRSSRYKGVCFVTRRDRWLMQISEDNRRIASRCFKTEEEAAYAYDEAARRHFGEFARLNFPRLGEQSALEER